jgi:hypothetical protein
MTLLPNPFPLGSIPQGAQRGGDLAERLPKASVSLPDVTIPALAGSWRGEVAAITENRYHLTKGRHIWILQASFR